MMTQRNSFRKLPFPLDPSYDEQTAFLHLRNSELSAWEAILNAKNRDVTKYLAAKIAQLDEKESTILDVYRQDRLRSWMTHCGNLTGNERLVQEVKRHHIYLCEQNLRLVWSIASKHKLSSQSHKDELVQEGTFGLMHAIERFDIDRGVSFATYASWWIRQSMAKHNQAFRTIVHYPTCVRDKESRIADLQRRYFALHGEFPSFEDIAKELGITLEAVLFATDRRRAQGVVSVSTLDEDTPTSGTLVIPDLPRVEEDIDAGRAQVLVRGALDKLTPMQRAIVCRRFGIDTDEKTLRDIGLEEGLTSERIRQIEAQALEKLRFLLKDMRDQERMKD